MGTITISMAMAILDSKLLVITRRYIYAQTPRFAHTLFAFKWEDQQRYLRNINFPPPLNFYIQLGRSTRVSREYKFPTPVKLYIQLGRSTRVSREYKFPTPVKLLHSIGKINKGI